MVIKYLKNSLEKYEIKTDIKKLAGELYWGAYNNSREAGEKFRKIFGLIKKAEVFNDKTSTKLIDTMKCYKRALLLEAKVEEELFFRSFA